MTLQIAEALGKKDILETIISVIPLVLFYFICLLQLAIFNCVMDIILTISSIDAFSHQSKTL